MGYIYIDIDVVHNFIIYIYMCVYMRVYMRVCIYIYVMFPKGSWWDVLVYWGSIPDEDDVYSGTFGTIIRIMNDGHK